MAEELPHSTGLDRQILAGSGAAAADRPAGCLRPIAVYRQRGRLNRWSLFCYLTGADARGASDGDVTHQF